MADYVTAFQALKSEVIDKMSTDNRVKLNYIVKMALHWLKHHSDNMGIVSSDPAMLGAKEVLIPHLSAIAMDVMLAGGIDFPQIMAAMQEVMPEMLGNLETLTEIK